MRTITRAGTTAMLAATLALVACGRGLRENGESFTPSGPIMIEVTNQNVQDVNVYLEQGGDEQRLGLVTTSNTVAFEIPENSVRAGTDIRLRVRPIGSPESFVTERILVQPGEVVELQVTPRLEHSHFVVAQE